MEDGSKNPAEYSWLQKVSSKNYWFFRLRSGIKHTINGSFTALWILLRLVQVGCGSADTLALGKLKSKYIVEACKEVIQIIRKSPKKDKTWRRISNIKCKDLSFHSSSFINFELPKEIKKVLVDAKDSRSSIELLEQKILYFENEVKIFRSKLDHLCHLWGALQMFIRERERVTLIEKFGNFQGELQRELSSKKQFICDIKRDPARVTTNIRNEHRIWAHKLSNAEGLKSILWKALIYNDHLNQKQHFKNVIKTYKILHEECWYWIIRTFSRTQIFEFLIAIWKFSKENMKPGSMFRAPYFSQLEYSNPKVTWQNGEVASYDVQVKTCGACGLLDNIEAESAEFSIVDLSLTLEIRKDSCGNDDDIYITSRRLNLQYAVEDIGIIACNRAPQIISEYIQDKKGFLTALFHTTFGTRVIEGLLGLSGKTMFNYLKRLGGFISYMHVDTRHVDWERICKLHTYMNRECFKTICPRLWSLMKLSKI